MEFVIQNKTRAQLHHSLKSWLKVEVSQCKFLILLLVDFSIQVLSSSAWPFSRQDPFSLPPEVWDVFLILVFVS